MNAIAWTSIAAPCLALAGLSFHNSSAPGQHGASASASGSVEAPAEEAQGQLRRVAPAHPEQDAEAEASDWRVKLASQDLAAREAEFDALVARAVADPAFQGRLAQWAENRESLEFAWTCRLALREAKAKLEEGSRGAFGGAWWRDGSPGDPFEDMRRRLFGEGDTLDPMDPMDPMGGLWVDPFGRGWRGRFQQVPPSPEPPSGSPGQPGAPSGSQSSAQSLHLEMGQGGVKVRLKKQENGQETSEEFSAGSLEELLEAHPELSNQLGGASRGGAGWFRFGGPGVSGAIPGNGFRWERTVEPLRTDRLGVYLRSEPRTEGGLEIGAVQPGSLAERLGLEPGQVLLKLNGRELRTRDDISDELRRRDPEASVEVEVRAADGTLTTKSWAPSQNPRGEPKPLAPGALPSTRKV